MVYLLHFNQPFSHARHYLGSADNLEARLARHASGDGARLMEVIAEAGITWQLARTWEGGHELERHKNAPRLCPLCNPTALRRGQI